MPFTRVSRLYNCRLPLYPILDRFAFTFKFIKPSKVKRTNERWIACWRTRNVALVGQSLKLKNRQCLNFDCVLLLCTAIELWWIVAGYFYSIHTSRNWKKVYRFPVELQKVFKLWTTITSNDNCIKFSFYFWCILIVIYVIKDPLRQFKLIFFFINWIKYINY